MSVNAQQIPESWETLSFQQAIEPVTDESKRVDRSDYLSEGSLPVIDQGEEFIGGYTNEISKRYDGPLPVIVFGDHTRRVKLVDFPFVVGAQGVKLLRPKDCWEPRFLAYLLPTLPLPDRGYGRHYQYLRQLKFSCPPRPLQRKIVAEIEKQFTRLEAGVAGLRRVQAHLKRYRAAVLKAACEGKLVPTEAELAREREKVAAASRRGALEENQSRDGSATQEDLGYETGAQLLERILTERRQKWNGKGKYKEPAKPDTANLPSLPEGWIWATVEQVSSWLAGSIQSGPFGSQLLHSEFVSEGVLAIGIDNVLDGRFSVGSNHRIRPEKYSALRKFTARPDDVVVTVMATVGRVCVLPEHLGPAIITKHCYRITPATIGIAPHFLALTLRADAPTRSHIFGNIRGQTRPGINGPILKVAPIPVPPLIEQQRILGEVERRLSVIEELEAVVNTNLQRATRIRQAMLHQAFSGNLVLEGK